MAMNVFTTTSFAAPQEQRRPLTVPPPTSAMNSAPGDTNLPAPAKPDFRQANFSSDQFSETKIGLPLLKNIALDQRDIWSSPKNLRFGDIEWIVPLAGITTASFMADTSISRAVTGSPPRVSKSTTFSNYGIAALGGGVGGLYLWGKMTHDDHKRETGLLSGEAAVDALGVTTALKYAFGRQRPQDGAGGGGFWHGGTSFPSDHAAVAWSAASVIAHEYPGPLTKLIAYGLASAITISRITGKDHFPTDTLVGSAIGWYIGRQIYREHHDPELGGDAVGPLLSDKYGEERVEGRKMGSPYVPLDSWVYPAFDRLAALGYIKSAYLGLRPWTRIECAQLVEEAGDHLRLRDTGSSEAARLYQSLRNEFVDDVKLMEGDRSNELRLESVYTRTTDISGTPLQDSYHFGQTLINDFGRPYGEGANLISGFSGWASTGRLAVYVRGEYQHAPSTPAYSQQVRDVIAQVDANPVQPVGSSANVNQFRLLDTYAAVNLGNWNLSFGKQSFWWGPGQGGSLIWSDNAEPLLMGRATRTIPEKLPGFLSWLGPARFDMFFGKLEGHQFPARPMIHGERISFKPTSRLEMGLSRTGVLGGIGHPLTLERLWKSYVGLQIHPAGNAAGQDPGDRRAAFDFSYRASDWLTLYNSFFWDDAIRRTAFNPGIYVPRVPGLPKLDLRAEVVSTDVSPDGPYGYGQLVYFNTVYHDAYTNKGNLLGSWVGRQGTGAQAWATYWISPRSNIEVSYRHGWINPRFIPQGGTSDDVSARADLRVRPDLSVSAFVQYESWKVPVLSPSPVTDVTTSFQLTFHPRWEKQ
jgi:hypothetical protein